MKLGILSDLHLSRAPQPAPRSAADVYVLAGDIGRPAEGIAWARALGTPVLYVPGNHEFYGRAMPDVLQELRELAAGSQVQVLSNEEACIGRVRFLGTTLWTDFLLDGPGAARERAMQEAQQRVHDFTRITLTADDPAPFSPEAAAALFRANVDWLEERLAEPWSGPTVVITHHAPSARSLDPRYAGSPLNACFASHLDPLVALDLQALWIHGHLHHSVDYRLGATRVVANPRGYSKDGRNENPAFDPDLVLQLD